MPSDVLGRSCYVNPRYEDPEQGFQRTLDKDRATSIAEYIDNGLGTIPNSVILSAQPAAELKVIGRGKTVEFLETPRSFLILDGQHRIYGYRLATTKLRVPVVIFNGLSRRDETRLFIDINTKQRPVPNELLLDIKKLAEYETDEEKTLADLYDLFNLDQTSPLLGLMTPSEKSKGKISRVTFNAAVKPIFKAFGTADNAKIFETLREYIRSAILGCDSIKAERVITNPTVFRAFMLLFPDVAQRVQDRYNQFTADNFSKIMAPIFDKMRPASFTQPVKSYRELYEILAKSLRQFSLTTSA